MKIRIAQGTIDDRRMEQPMNTVEETISQASTEKLKEWYLNAFTTHCKCAGHYKAAMNEMLFRKYEDELRRRGIAVPANRYEDGVGTFNGEGAF